MRTFYFKARNIGQEKYLTYTMGEETELDEDVLDYCEENDIRELVDIIYEEDDDYDYLTYDITGRKSLHEMLEDEVSAEQALFIVRNVANNLISLKEQTIHLSYILLNREYVYVDDNNEVTFICLPVESKGSLSVEFKGFLRQLLANMKYDVDEDLNFVGKLLTYINGGNFNLRGLVGLAEALMDEAGIEFEEAGAIESDGVEVVDSSESKTEETDTAQDISSNMANFMSEADNVPLPEIGDDEEEELEEAVDDEEEELESILPAGMSTVADEAGAAKDETKKAEPEVPEPVESKAEESEEDKTVEKELTDETKDRASDSVESDKQELEQIPEIAVPESSASDNIEQKPTVSKPAHEKEEDLDVIKDKIKALVGDDEAPVKKPEKVYKSVEEMQEALKKEMNPAPPKKNVVKVNKAAIIQSLAEHEAEEAEKEKEKEAEAEAVKDNEESAKEKDKKDEKKEDTSKPNTLLNAPKAMPYLIRVNTEERIMLNKPVFKLGKASRGVDYTISGNGAISRQHAVITQKDGVCYIKDNKSTNHTYVNDRVVDEGVEEILTHDSSIKLGDEEFIFKIR
ncbi:MAG: FHA domain-containing protein [Lachnospiraceae bacterium]|nr:FHA domain-containing protein [Lachnospiraceae bacterium]